MESQMREAIPNDVGEGGSFNVTEKGADCIDTTEIKRLAPALIQSVSRQDTHACLSVPACHARAAGDLTPRDRECRLLILRF